MNPSRWGPHGWFFMHSITFTYPTNPTQSDKDNMKNFFLSMKEVLPCEQCRKNFNKHLKKFPLTSKVLSSRYNLSLWLVHIHNQVTKITGGRLMTYEQAKRRYS